MPTAGKIFEYRESLSLQEIAAKLDGYKESGEFNEGDYQFEIVQDIEDLVLNEDGLSGTFRSDGVDIRHHRSGMKAIPYTTDASFIFIRQENATYLVVLAKKTVANNIANKLSLTLHGQMGAIVNPVITPKALTGFYESGEGTKILLLSELVIPNMNKLTLYGLNVVQTDLYGQFIGEGEPWYAVFKTVKEGWTIGLVRDGAVVVFDSIDMQAFIDFMKERIIPLILKRS